MPTTRDVARLTGALIVGAFLAAWPTLVQSALYVVGIARESADGFSHARREADTTSDRSSGLLNVPAFVWTFAPAACVEFFPLPILCLTHR